MRKLFFIVLVALNFHTVFAQHTDSATCNQKIDTINSDKELDSVVMVAYKSYSIIPIYFHDTFLLYHPYKFHPTQLIVPVVLLGYGTAAVASKPLKDFSKNINSDLHSNGVHPFGLDNYSQFVPIAGVYALNLAGVKGQHNYVDLTIISGTSYIIAGILTEGLKHAVHEWRPDSSNRFSFPSSHAVIAFTGAEIVWQEYKYVSVWYGVGAYAIAAGTGFLRMYNDKHWLHDVAMGAGVGILSAKVAYWIFPPEDRLFKKIFNVKNHSLIKSTSLVPYYNGSQYGAGLSFGL